MNSKRTGEKIIYWLMRGITYLVVVFIAYILIDILIHGLPAISWEFITGDPEKSGAEGGIFPAILGTFFLVIGTIVVALPLGMFSAIYLTEYAKQSKFTQTIRMAIVTLAGVPSIVFGLFGLGLFVIALDFGASILAGSLTLACMILPTIIVASEEALKAVPKYMREGSLALGATKWETIYKNVLPYALPGMLTGGNHLQECTSLCTAGYADRRDSGNRQSSGRNRSDSVNSSCILSAGAAKLCV